MFWSDVAHHEILAARLNGSQLVKLVNTGITTPGMQVTLHNLILLKPNFIINCLSSRHMHTSRIRAEIRPYIWKSRQCQTKYDGASQAPAASHYYIPISQTVCMTVLLRSW